jgi:hypothetical protein
MERGLMMFLHALMIGIILYLVMVFALGQPSGVAEDRSVLLGGIILVYMILFGHGLPGKVNKNIM